MAEIRKHNPTTSDIGEQVRALLGENIRPLTPGQHHRPDDDLYDPYTEDGDETEDDNDIIPFTAGGSPLIGVLPVDFTSWDDDDDPAA